MPISFQDTWLSDPAFKSWLLKAPGDQYSAKCSLCLGSLINIRSMGRTALKSHMTKCKKHTARASAQKNAASLQAFHTTDVKKKTEVGSSSQPALTIATGTISAVPTLHHNVPDIAAPENAVPIAGVSKLDGPRGLKTMLLNDEVTKAEILWCMQCVVTHQSARSAASAENLFPTMFNDSIIANKMQLQKDKIGYIVQYGLAPHFKREIDSDLAKASRVVVSFDESLNKVCKKNQMDFQVRFWDVDLNQVCTRYYTSAFLGRATAAHLLNAFKDHLPATVLRKLLQVSMDGPNVNFVFLKDLKIFLKDSDIDAVLLDIGSCGLHVVHGAFKSAMVETSWGIVQFLRAIYNLFKEVPARRALYTSVTNSEEFPLKFCAVRWLENKEVAQRALVMLPSLKIFVQAMEEKKTKPSCASFKIVEEHLRDNMLGPKIAFFKTIATDLEPFLRQFQSDWPLAPFLHSTLTSVVQTVMGRFVKSELISPSVDLKKDSNLLNRNYIKIGFGTESEIKKCKSVTDLQMKLFRDNCKKALIKFVSKMMDRSPLKYRLTKAISCFDPTIACQKIGSERFTHLLKILVEHNWVTGDCADRAEVQLNSLCSSPKAKRGFSDFKMNEDRLDNLWVDCLKDETSSSSDLKRVIEIVLTLSHGQSAVERGFAINGECLFDNMQEESVVSRRIVYDTVKSYGGVELLPISKSLIHSVRNARSCYHDYLKKRKAAELEENDASAQRKMNKVLVRELQSKKAKLDSAIQNAEREKEILEGQISVLSEV